VSRNLNTVVRNIDVLWEQLLHVVGNEDLIPRDSIWWKCGASHVIEPIALDR
jgi:hypothetical protein